MLTKDERIVVDILMERDNLSFDEACDALNDAMSCVWDALAEGYDVEQVWEMETGLEPDYLMNIL